METREEFLAGVLARLIGDARHVAVGAASPIPAMAAFLQREKLGGSPRISLLHQRRGNPFVDGSRELFDMAGQGRIDVFFLGGGQIDGEGAINLVHAGGKRFPGSFGSAYMYSVIPGTILFREEHSRRVLVPKVEFVSATGKPKALLTGMALFAWQADKRRFRLESVHPDFTAADVERNTGFAYDVEARVPETPPLSPEERLLMKNVVAKRMAESYPEFARRVWGA